MSDQPFKDGDVLWRWKDRFGVPHTIEYSTEGLRWQRFGTLLSPPVAALLRQLADANKRIAALEKDVDNALWACRKYSKQLTEFGEDINKKREAIIALEAVLKKYRAAAEPALAWINADDIRPVEVICSLEDAVAHDTATLGKGGQTETEATCDWREDEDGNWNTTCDGRFQTTIGTPRENRMTYCAFCGKRIVEHRYVNKQGKENGNGN